MNSFQELLKISSCSSTWFNPYKGRSLLFSHWVMPDSFSTTWTVAHEVPLSMEFPRQEHWIRLPFPSPGDLPNLGIKPTSPTLAGGFFTTEPPGKAIELCRWQVPICSWHYQASVISRKLQNPHTFIEKGKNPKLSQRQEKNNKRTVIILKGRPLISSMVECNKTSP